MKKIDASKITDYNLSHRELESVILFWICAAGKNGDTAANCLYNLLTYWENLTGLDSPFLIIRHINENFNLPDELRKYGIGCFSIKAKSFIEIAYSGFDLKQCTLKELESIFGIGPKTARCFLIHSRPNQNYAGLDVHVLRFLKDKGHTVPVSTPSGKKYYELEKIFLEYVKESKKTVSEFDLMIWNSYRFKKAI